MTKSKNHKTKSKAGSAKKAPVGKTSPAAFDAALAYFHAATPSRADRRKELLAQVAGSIAGDIISAPSPATTSESSMASSIATIAVDIAEEILRRAGIPPTASPAEETPAAEAGVNAAS